MRNMFKMSLKEISDLLPCLDEFEITTSRNNNIQNITFYNYDDSWRSVCSFNSKEYALTSTVNILYLLEKDSTTNWMPNKFIKCPSKDLLSKITISGVCITIHRNTTEFYVNVDKDLWYNSSTETFITKDELVNEVISSIKSGNKVVYDYENAHAYLKKAGKRKIRTLEAV